MPTSAGVWKKSPGYTVYFRLRYDAWFPHDLLSYLSLRQACSWNVPLVERMTSYAAAEGRISGIDWTFSPMIGVARDPRWGRVSRAMERIAMPMPLSVPAALYADIRIGADSTTIAACLKHYVA